jgi:hypothetical protein
MIIVGGFLESSSMAADEETVIANKFLVECEDGSQETVIERTTYLIHRGTGRRSANKKEWFLNGESLIVDPSNPDPLNPDVLKNVWGKDVWTKALGRFGNFSFLREIGR